MPLQKNRLPGAGRGSRISKGRRGPTHFFGRKIVTDSSQLTVRRLDLFEARGFEARDVAGKGAAELPHSIETSGRLFRGGPFAFCGGDWVQHSCA